jgi:hypothetical protein
MTLKGVCIYTSETGNVGKMDLKIPVPVSAIMVPEPEELTDLLTSGILEHSSGTVRQCEASSFDDVLQGLSTNFCFAVVEHIENAAYLHAKSLKGHHIAFKIKFDPSKRTLSVDGKSNSAQILNSLSDEILALPL